MSARFGNYLSTAFPGAIFATSKRSQPEGYHLMSVALLYTAQGTSGSMMCELGLTSLPSPAKIADRGRHLVDQSCKLRRSEVIVGSKIIASCFISPREQIQSPFVEVFGIGKQERHDIIPPLIKAGAISECSLGRQSLRYNCR
jgi:hypothetical protein